jgi:hypothetical protein
MTLIIGYEEYLKNHLCNKCIKYLDLDDKKDSEKIINFKFCEKCDKIVGDY